MMLAMIRMMILDMMLVMIFHDIKENSKPFMEH